MSKTRDLCWEYSWFLYFPLTSLSVIISSLIIGRWFLCLVSLYCFVCWVVSFLSSVSIRLSWVVWQVMTTVRATGVELQEIPQLIIIYEIWLQPTSRRFLRELDEAPGGNNLYYILQCLCVPASVTRVWTRKVRWVATECSWNDGSKTQYYVVILDQLQGRSGGLGRAPELRIRGLLTTTLSIPDLKIC